MDTPKALRRRSWVQTTPIVGSDHTIRGFKPQYFSGLVANFLRGPTPKRIRPVAPVDVSLGGSPPTLLRSHTTTTPVHYIQPPVVACLLPLLILTGPRMDGPLRQVLPNEFPHEFGQVQPPT